MFIKGLNKYKNRYGEIKINDKQSKRDKGMREKTQEIYTSSA